MIAKAFLNVPKPHKRNTLSYDENPMQFAIRSSPTTNKPLVEITSRHL